MSSSLRLVKATKGPAAQVHDGICEYSMLTNLERTSASMDDTNPRNPVNLIGDTRKRPLSSSESELSHGVPTPRKHVGKLFAYSPIKQPNIVNSANFFGNIPPLLFPSTSYACNESSNEELHCQGKRLTHRSDNQMVHTKEAITPMDERMIRIEATMNNTWSHSTYISSAAFTVDPYKEKLIENTIREKFPLTDREALRKLQEELQSPD
ncbi:hypothetical protein PHET_12043 [Paragonimus heterotremus]|uniref:Uncharacterized protein n=1 Tax=Paragonimus heterotremus TaxID=100268 RepID=A0A8J4WCC9_9TREM|nr:hypothetical protein PHET_12043 [Paragonimus heterotremus]